MIFLAFLGVYAAVVWKRFAIRDAIVALIAGLAVWLEPQGGVLVAGVGGVLLTVVGFFVHEWGHLTGAQFGDAQVHPPTTLWSPFLFFFDLDENTPRGFLWMSYGGYFGSILGLGLLFVPALFVELPLSIRIAQGLALLGVLVTFALEVPATLRAHRGVLPTHGAAYTKKKTPRD